MSALGQNRTCAPQDVMSALPPEADMCSALAHVCFGPIADIASCCQRLQMQVNLCGIQARSARSLCLGWNDRRSCPVFRKNLHKQYAKRQCGLILSGMCEVSRFKKVLPSFIDR